MSNNLKVISFNVKGLGTPEKRTMLLNDLWRLRAQVALLQETHFRQDRIPRLSNRRYGHSYHSCSTDSRSRGVSVLVAQSVPWQLRDIQCDGEGRYLAVKGTVASKLYTFVSVYLPNAGQNACLESLLDSLRDFTEGTLIMGGDFNLAPDPSLDSSRGATALPTSSLRRFKHLLHSHQLIDVWRVLHPRERDYTFYSPVHDSYSRIDFFLIRHHELGTVCDAGIDTSHVSDHSPISLSIYLEGPPPPRGTWHLNESLLQDPDIVGNISSELEQFFTINADSSPNPLTIWETHKCYIRGIFMSHGARVKRERMRQSQDLLGKIKHLETSHKQTPNAVRLAELTALRERLRLLEMSKAKAMLSKCKGLFYEYGDKCGRMLANALRKRRAHAYIPHIRDRVGELQHLPKTIANTFKDYYKSLYNITNLGPSRIHSIREYISNSGLPPLPTGVVEKLEAPLSQEELEKALRDTASGKAPGPDGFTLRYYKQFLTILAPKFLLAFNSLAEDQSMPRDTLFAHITVIPKEGKDPAQCASYRPISLLNVDVKLFAKILASRLTPHLQEIIHTDQAGFLPSREARDNTTRALDIIHHARSNSLPMLLLSTDAEKAFDRVDWEFLAQSLKHIGLGHSMLSWVFSLYCDPTAAVKVNGFTSDPFSIQNGTRQGCPLSPLLFILSLEPFLRTIRGQADVSGLRLGNQQHKIAAYADDLLFFLTSPHISLPNLMNELRVYGSLSNFKINLQKCEALSVGIPPSVLAVLQSNFRFRWAPHAIKYLGILLPADLSTTFALNFLPMLRTMKTDLESWRGGLFSWFGKCNIVKMNLLPRLLYLFQALPVYIPFSFFQSLRRLWMSFIWSPSAPRVARAVLTQRKEMGGVALPDPFRYYIAAHLTRIVDWCRHSTHKRWIEVEQGSTEIPLQNLPWISLTSLTHLTSHITIGPTLRLAARFLASAGLSPSPSPLFPILGNPAFPPGVVGRCFGAWLRGGRYRIRHFLDGSQWVTGPDLVSPPDLPPLDAWGLRQLSHFLSSLPRSARVNRVLTPFESLCSSHGPTKRSLSLIYNWLIAPGEGEFPPYLSKWERDLGVDWTGEERIRILTLAHGTSIATRYQETNYKLLSRWYRVPSVLGKMFPGVSTMCWRCGREEGTLLHVFWSCSLLTRFWTEIRTISSQITGWHLEEDAGLFLLHHSNIPLQKYKQSLLRHLLNAARACIPALWKSTTPPTATHWISRVNEIMRMEYLTSLGRKGTDRLDKTWLDWQRFTMSEEGVRFMAAQT